MTDRIVQYHSVKNQLVSQINTNVAMLEEKDVKLVQYALNKEWSNPKYKLEYFVGGAQITPFAKLRQWLLEIRSREESIETLEYEIAKWEIEIARQSANVDAATDEFDRALAQLELKKVTDNHIKTKRRLADWYLERQQLIDLVNEFQATEEAILPDGTGRTYFDVLDTAEENVYEKEYWTNRLGKQAACDLLFYGRINTGNMDAILSMTPEQQADTIKLAVNYATRLQQYQNSVQEEVNNDLGISPGFEMPDTSLTLPKAAQAANTTAPTGTEDDLDVYNS